VDSERITRTARLQPFHHRAARCWKKLHRVASQGVHGSSHNCVAGLFEANRRLFHSAICEKSAGVAVPEGGAARPAAAGETESTSGGCLGGLNNLDDVVTPEKTANLPVQLTTGAVVAGRIHTCTLLGAEIHGSLCILITLAPCGGRSSCGCREARSVTALAHFTLLVRCAPSTRQRNGIHHAA